MPFEFERLYLPEVVHIKPKILQKICLIFSIIEYIIFSVKKSLYRIPPSLPEVGEECGDYDEKTKRFYQKKV
ncbi:MAG: hypothetical protein QXM53_08535 [Thermofilaceae archaeon]